MARVALKINIPMTDVYLNTGQVWRAEGDLRGEVIRCDKGALWITQRGDLNDYFLKAGESFWVTKPGMLLVQAIRQARFNCSRGTPPTQSEVYAHLGAE